MLNPIFVKNMVILSLFKEIAKGNMIPIFMQHDSLAKAKQWADDIEKAGNLNTYFNRMIRKQV